MKLALLNLETVYLFSFIFLSLPDLQLLSYICEVQVCLQTNFPASVRLSLGTAAVWAFFFFVCFKSQTILETDRFKTCWQRQYFQHMHFIYK